MKQLILFILLVTAQSALASQSTFKMYREPHAKVDPHCDSYTELLLNVDGNIGQARLTHRLAGECDMYFEPNVRNYNLVFDKNDCGTVIYTQDEDADEAIEVIDNRGRVCENLIPALIVLKEYGSN